ncbi:AAA-like domain-containing protein [uncultured Treponema sp.]|uniref:AAA-like domain-containing protein n=1 Tax=uncultured Treponema sp. TaxID=162155 RepID=UPI0025D9C3D2|nr:AAA-like domain-containing protein [uncultured Treponema sp.]
MKRFNTTGTCFAYKHYMVNIDERVQQIKKMVDRGDYFCINRGRQYGKTTTLNALTDVLNEEYTTFFISFEGMSDSSFASLENCGQAFFEKLRYQVDNHEVIHLDSAAYRLLKKVTGSGLFSKKITSDNFSDIISELVKSNSHEIVVIIDEVDQAGNYDSFIKFLGVLRNNFLHRDKIPTFHSVILAGVYDVKNLKLKMRPDTQHQYNSPWNIAANFDVNMDLSESGIQGMLEDYEADHHTGMDSAKMAKLLWDYTSGYPFLVSRLCQIIDENLNADWTEAGFLEAIKVILNERNTLFDDMIKKFDSFPEMKNMLKEILYDGEKIPYNADDREVQIATMFNFIKNAGGKVKLSNRIFETRMYNLFQFEATVSKSEEDNEIIRNGSIDTPLFIKNGKLDMKKVLERFCVHFNEIYDTKDEKFIEKQGRKFFLFFLKPIINGTGNYYVEAETRDERRMDVVVDYVGERFVIELKIWRGDSYNEQGEQQLSEYLDYYGLEKGYLISFCFNKGKQSGVHEVKLGNRTIIEAVV